MNNNFPLSARGKFLKAYFSSVLLDRAGPVSIFGLLYNIKGIFVSIFYKLHKSISKSCFIC